MDCILELIYNGELKSEQNNTKVFQLLKDFILDEVFDINLESRPKQEINVKHNAITDTETIQIKKDKQEKIEKKSLKCDYCGHISTKQSSLKSHKAVKHLNIRSS